MRVWDGKDRQGRLGDQMPGVLGEHNGVVISPKVRIQK